MEGVIFLENFIDRPKMLFEDLKAHTNWDERMISRKTASYGVAYDYSQMHYPFQEMPEALAHIASQMTPIVGFTPNNCLINYYLDGKSKMGFHSDQTDILEENTGIAIVSLGETRILRFKKIDDQEETIDFMLPEGSLLYMTQEVQQVWVHAIPKSNTELGRISLTFRRIKTT